jgi:hypothetical protein
MRRIVSFVLFMILLVTLGSCIWVHERDEGGRERGEHERGEHFEHEERR